MPNISRRDFLRALAAGMGAVALGRFLEACSGAPASSSPSEPPPFPSSAPTRVAPRPADTIPSPTFSPRRPLAGTLAPTPTSASYPDLVVVRQGEPEALVRTALAALGGMQKFVPRGANVVVKPNICVAYHSYEYAATTNPWVVGTLVKLCFEAGAASVKVFDLPFGGTDQEAYTRSGIQEQVQANGGEMLAMPTFKYISAQIPGGLKLKQTRVFSDILNADVLINVPIAKHHSAARLTLGMKNLMGVILDRSALHADLGQDIADLNTLIRPKLTVIDAVRILMNNGPTGGSLDDVKKLDTLVASADIVAADSYATSFFGRKPADIPYIQAAAALGLGRSDLSAVNIQELAAGA